MLVGEGHLLIAVHNKSFESGDRLVEFGTYNFTGTNATVEVPTNLSAIEAAFLTPKTIAYNANDKLVTDGIITNDAVTVARNTGGSSGLQFYYMLIGYRYN